MGMSSLFYLALSDVKIQAPKVSQSLSKTPRNTGVGVVTIRLSAPFATLDEPITLTTSEVKNTDGDVMKGNPMEYEIDIMGPDMVDGTIGQINDDGSFALTFTPTSVGARAPPTLLSHPSNVSVPGKYFVQVYFRDVPLFGDYYEVTVREA